jgi:hypothetical protein
MVASGSSEISEVSIWTSPPTAYCLLSGPPALRVRACCGHVGLLVGAHFAVSALEFFDLALLFFGQFFGALR